MKGIVYKNIPFANHLLAFALAKFDQIVAYVNQVPQYNFDSETWILTFSDVYKKFRFIITSFLEYRMVQDYITKVVI